MNDWILFLDDIRDYNDRFFQVRIARSMMEAQQLIQQFGLPTIVSLDHDLGENQPTGYDFVKWLIDQDIMGKLDISNINKFYVHSANPVGRDNMLGLWHSYTKFLYDEQV